MEHNRDPKVDLQKCQLIFDKGVKPMQWGKNILLTNGTGTNGHPQAKNEPSYRPILLLKINSDWFRDLNIKCETENPRT